METIQSILFLDKVIQVIINCNSMLEIVPSGCPLITTSQQFFIYLFIYCAGSLHETYYKFLSLFFLFSFLKSKSYFILFLQLFYIEAQNL